MKKIKTKVKKYDWKDIGQRMLKTFIQGILSYLILSLNGITNPNDIVLESLLLGALASGISAVMNVLIQEMEMRQ